MGLIFNIKDGDWTSVRQAISKLATKIGPKTTPTHNSVKLTDLTATRLVQTDATKTLASVTNLASWIAGTANEIDITDDGDGTITIGLINPLMVAKGGTGAATLTNHGILLGSGTDAITPLAAASNGQLPIGSTDADPVLAGLTGTANQITVTNGAGSITLSTPQDIATTSSPTWVNNTLTGYLDLTEISEPASPAGGSNLLRLYAEAIQGFSFLKFIDDTGMKREIVRDSLILVKNVRGTTIAANRIVYATGSEDDVPTIDLAKADSITTMPAIGVTIESIANDAFGRVMQVGLLENINTSALSEGDVLYVSAATEGVPVTTAPAHPNLNQEVGTVLVSDASTGAIQIVARGLTGDESGTAQNSFTIGDQTAAAKSLIFDTGNLGTLSWNPTDTRTITIPDATGTIALTSGLHDAVTVTDSASVNLTLAGQDITADVLPAGVDHNSLNNTHNLTTDIDHDQTTNVHQDVNTTASPAFIGLSIQRTLASDFIGASCENLDASGGSYWNVNNDQSGHYMNFVAHGSTYAGTLFGINRADTMMIWSEGCTTVLGTYSANTLILGTNNTARITITSDGTTTVGSLNGIIKGTSGVLSAITDNSTNWDTAYTHSQIAGGNSVHVSTTENTNWDAAYTHVSNNGTDHSYIDQNVTTTGTPSFTSASLGTGELTCGSINRASGTLTLEIGGTAELSLTTTTATFGGSVIIPDSGTIGSASDTDVMTIDASGNTTFSVFPITPSAAPDADYEVANKKYVDDNAGGAYTSRCSVYLSGTQSVNTATLAKVEFDTENYDGDNEFDSTTNYRFTATDSGYYHVSASAFITSLAAQKYTYTGVYINGTSKATAIMMSNDNPGTWGGNISRTFYLSANDYVEIKVYHINGSSRDIAPGDTYTYLTIDRIA